MRTQQLLYIAAGVVAFVILLLIGWGLTHVGKDGGGRASAGFVGAVERAQAATVMVTVSGSGADEAPLQMGSGFVASSDGLIVTAAHVTGGLPVFNAVFADGSVARAELVIADTEADVAIYRATPGRALVGVAVRDTVAGGEVVWWRYFLRESVLLWPLAVVPWLAEWTHDVFPDRIGWTLAAAVVPPIGWLVILGVVALLRRDRRSLPDLLARTQVLSG